jgi:hypothetical protein
MQCRQNPTQEITLDPICQLLLLPEGSHRMKFANQLHVVGTSAAATNLGTQEKDHKLDLNCQLLLKAREHGRQ